MVSNKIFHRLCSPNRFEKWLLSAGCYRDIWSCLVASEMEQRKLATGLVSGAGSAELALGVGVQ